MSKRNNSASEYSQNVRARVYAEIDTPHEYRELTSFLQPKQIQCLALAIVALLNTVLGKHTMGSVCHTSGISDQTFYTLPAEWTAENFKSSD